MSVLQVLYDPDVFFEQRVERPTFVGPLVIVLLAGLTGTLQGWLMFTKIGDALAQGTSTIFAVVQAGGSIAALLTIFVLWFAYTAVFYLLSTAYDSEGSFLRLLKLVGWGHVPAIFSSVVSAVAMYSALQSVSAPETQADLQSFVLQLQSQPEFLIASLLGAAFTIWQGFIWTFAVKHARGVTLKQAAVVVGIPVALSVIWSVVNLM